jgi:hypothetical protein
MYEVNNMIVAPKTGEMTLLSYILGLKPVSDKVLHLYVNNVNPTDSINIGQLTECTSAGYEPIILSASNWSIVEDKTGTATGVYPKVNFRFMDAVEVWGLYVTDTDNNLLWCEKFTKSCMLSELGGLIQIDPQIQLA